MGDSEGIGYVVVTDDLDGYGWYPNEDEGWFADEEKARELATTANDELAQGEIPGRFGVAVVHLLPDPEVTTDGE